MTSTLSLEEYRANIPESVQRHIVHFRAQHERIIQLERELNQLRKNHADLRRQLEPYRIEVPFTNLASGRAELSTSFSNQPIRCLINKCPDDILYLIFEAYISRSQDHEFIWRLFLTCKRWHNIVMNSPKLWAQINISDSLTLFDIVGRENLLPYVSTCITRSGANPLVVSLNMRGISPGNYISWKLRDYVNTIVSTGYDLIGDRFMSDPWNIPSSWFDMKLDQALNILIGSDNENIQRWEKLALWLPENGNVAVDLWRRFGKWLQNLKQLTIYNIPAGWNVEPFYSSCIQTLPNVKHLELSAKPYGLDFTISSIGVSPQMLNYLKICVDSRLIPMENLSSFTQLRELRVICCDNWPFWSDTSIDRSNDILALPRLEILALVGGYGILNNINFNLPSLDTLRLEIRGQTCRLLNLSPRRIQLMPPLWMTAGYELKDVARDLILQSSILESITIYSVNRAELEETVAECKRDGKAASLKQIIIDDDNGRVEVVNV